MAQSMRAVKALPRFNSKQLAITDGYFFSRLSISLAFSICLFKDSILLS